jgi:hypothetical protein|tara:strand:+ start:35 stop:1075 length:1041 start_codon:yes stop_codon:yes gene_type:complete
MAYTTINKSTDNFNTKLYTGNGGTQSLTGVGFQPDWVWIKRRDSSGSHIITDAVRGTGKIISSDGNGAEFNEGSNGVSAFGTDGFSIGNLSSINTNSGTFASWNWKAGTTGSGTTTGSGSYKTYSYSVNTTAGFSIIKYKGNGTNGHQIPHHLGTTPSMTIIKITSGSDNWIVQSANRGWDKRLILDTTNVEAAHTDFVTGVSSTTLTLQTNGSVNGNDADYIAYVFAEKTGYSKFGSYTGNGSHPDGNFIYTGFKPSWFMVKNVSANGHSWYIVDNKIDPDNPTNKYLVADTSAAEAAFDWFDLNSNGIKIRGNSGGANSGGDSYFYMAFGQSLVGSNNVPCTAR